MNYKGVIIEESLDKTDFLKEVNIITTKIEQVTKEHKTPWLKQWTLHTVEILEQDVNKVVKKLSNYLENNWYADFKNNKYHYIVYRSKIFKVDLKNPSLYKDAKQYGISLGIPEYQVDFAPDDNVWEREAGI